MKELKAAAQEFALTVRACELLLIEPRPANLKAATAFLRAATHQLDPGGVIQNPAARLALYDEPHGAERDWR